MFVSNAKATTEIDIRLPRKKSDLTLIVRFVVEVAVPDESFPGDAFDLIHRNARVSVSWKTIMSDKIVSR
jgi:hypothetical protein